MPLFTTNRDAGFLKGINRELLHRIVSNEVALYQISLEASDQSIYNEASDKVYNQPVRLFALIRMDAKESNDDEFGVNFTRTISVGIAKTDLRDKGVYLYSGDIIEYDGSFYEIDVVKTSQYWAGKNPNTLIGVEQDSWSPNGYDHSVICDCHLTNLSGVSITKVRTAPDIDKNESSIPKNI